MKIKFCLSNSWGFHSLCLSWSLISLLAVSVEQKLLLAPRSETRGVKWSREPAACFILYFGSREETEWCDTRSHLLFSYWLSDLEAELCLLSLTKQGWVYFWQHISCDIINVWSSGNCGELLTASSHAIFAAHMHAHTHTHTHTSEVHTWGRFTGSCHLRVVDRMRDRAYFHSDTTSLSPSGSFVYDVKIQNRSDLKHKQPSFILKNKFCAHQMLQQDWSLNRLHITIMI